MSQILKAGMVKASNNVQTTAKHQIVTRRTETHPHTCKNYDWVVKNYHAITKGHTLINFLIHTSSFTANLAITVFQLIIIAFKNS